jgi:hypothetical protein
MSVTPTFFWDGDSATISAGLARLRLQAIVPDPLRWALYDGYRRLGTVSRYENDATPIGEPLLWDRILELLTSMGQDPEQWDFRPGRGTL